MKIKTNTKMNAKTIVSSKGQVIIPKFMRELIGLHVGSEFTIHLREDNVLEFKLVKRSIKEFFGKGASKIGTGVIDIDEAIAEAIEDNNL